LMRHMMAFFRRLMSMGLVPPSWQQVAIHCSVFSSYYFL
jgi:hypothetical protein